MEDITYWRPAILGTIAQDRPAIIEASAGTGKTHTIGHLLVDLLLGATATLEQILVVTFTEKATAELRARIRNLIEKISRGESQQPAYGDDQPTTLDRCAQQRLYDALYSFDRAAVFTIHGFCQRVLTELAFHSGTRFELDVVDARGAFHRAFRAELRERLSIESPARELLAIWLADRDIAELENLLLRAHQRRYLEAHSADSRREFAHRFIDSFSFAGLKQECGLAGLKRGQLNQALAVLAELDQFVKDARGSAEVFLRSIKDLDFTPLVRVAKSSSGFSGLFQATTELQLAGAAEGSLEASLVEACLPAVAARLDRDKREHGRIDYDDMLLWVWRALDGPRGNALLEVLRHRYRYGLVDEFQDTDDLQWRIFKRIFVEGTGSHRLFVVGDPKQAIYAFRGADVHAYLNARRELVANGTPCVALQVNFRSTAEMIAVHNCIFDQSVEHPFFNGEIRYDHPVTCGSHKRTAIDARGREITPVTIMRYERTDGGKGRADHAREAFGRYIAATISELLNDSALAISIEEPAQEPRTVLARDVFVLTRTNNESEEIGAHLREAGVPFAFYKLDGLFQTREARDVLDVLRAIQDPHDRSRRLRAWASPFFDVMHRDLPSLGDVPATDPLHGRLYEWRLLAESEQFADLFDHLLHNSGLADRELFLLNSERELTNYIHIFEVLLERAVSRRLSIAEIIELLADYIFARAEPPGPEGNIQRLESERAAVQVMTVHLSKGLEADVVFLYGGTYGPTNRDDLVIYHDGNERKFAIGKDVQNIVKEHLAREESEENQRLLYVALTRARAKLYLPFFPPGSIKKPNGYYSRLNDRLGQIVSDLAITKRSTDYCSKLFTIDDVCASRAARAPRIKYHPLSEWSVPAELLKEDAEPESIYTTIRKARAPLAMHSYTSLKRQENAPHWDIASEEFNADLEPSVQAADLPGGSQVGIFLHDVLERVDLASFGDAPEFILWREQDHVKELFEAAMRRHQIREQRWFDRGRELVYNALTGRFAVTGGRIVGPLYACPNVRELEFLYPIPEGSHPIFARSGDEKWIAERGYLKGFVDFVFEQDGLVYFADWKSDLLTSYEPSSVQEHVMHNYELQARIYSVGVMRLLRIRSEAEYRERFGGLLYIFLRGIESESVATRGLYFHRPQWTEVSRNERELMQLPGLV